MASHTEVQSRLDRSLGASDDARLSRLGFGCEQLGAYEWGRVDVSAIGDAIAAAVDVGVRLFDTADCYGKGESERYLGRFLGPVRERVFVATKFGVRFNSNGKVHYDSSPEWAEAALQGSMARLRCDYVDLFQIHYWDGRTPLEETFERLEKFREGGLIRWYGITNLDQVPFDTLAQYPGFATVSMEYSLAARQFEGLGRRVCSRGLSFLSHGSLGQGILSGKYDTSHEFPAGDRRSRSEYRHFHGDLLSRNLSIVEVLRNEAATLSVTLPQLAVAWILQAIPGSIPLVGIKSVAQLMDIVHASEIRIPPDTFSRLDHISRDSQPNDDSSNQLE